MGDATPPRPAWTAAPPIQRSFDTLRPVSPQQEFAGSLVSWRDPSFLAPLGHLVSPDAPAGVIHRLIEPAAPPTARPAGPALAFAAAPPRAGVVQRMLAAISPRASQESEPPPPMPGSGVPSRTRLAAPLPNPPPAPDPVVPSASRPVPVQRSAPGPAQLMQAPPPPSLPVLELPVQPTGTETASETTPEPEPDAVDGAPLPTAEPPPSGDGDDQEAPTLGMELPTSGTRPTGVDGGVSGSAGATEPEGRATAPVPEVSGRPAPPHPTVQRTVETGPLPPAAPPETTTGDATASRRLGLGPPLTPDAVTAQRVPASPVATPPVAVPPLPPRPTDPPELRGTGPVEGTGPDDSPLPAEEIAPLVGESGPVAAQRDVTAIGEPASRTVEDANPPLATSAAETHPPGPAGVTAPGAPDTGPELPALPVLRVHDSAAPTSTDVPLDATTTAPPGPVLP
ncbi:MAG: hypothetical protein ACRDRZ_15605, partial [Pseudonocardiaceae bacterium]